MLRASPCRETTGDLLTLDSGATTHMMPQSLVQSMKDTDIKLSDTRVKTAREGDSFDELEHSTEYFLLMMEY
jgi:hypothetical protein